MSNDGRLAGARWNNLLKEILERYDARVDMLKDELLRSEYPPFHVPRTPREQYDALVAAYMAWSLDAEDMALLGQLAQRFGPPPPRVVGPYGAGGMVA